MIEAPEWKDMADWSSLPDVYVTKAECSQGMFWRIEACSVPMVIGPEVRLVRADLAAERERKLVEVLKFYADPDLDGYEIHVTNYGLSTEDGHIIKDAGDKARATLKEFGYE